ncbi:GntR family transcriptional regulator [Parafilimonas sp.]|uniref:GntR family transcriptional regulator n=1 Tax=Parafilimonas sp. TaxID=1969739 RepID=UPI0039E275A4
MKRKLPIYRQLYLDIKKDIDAGKYKAGDMLPSENDLCASYNITRLTVRQALKELKVRGYIASQHGKGSIVQEPKKGLGILSIGGITAAIGNKSLSTIIIKKPITGKWPGAFFYELSEQEKKAGCVSFIRVRSVDHIPIVYEETFLANSGIKNFVRVNLENASLFNTLHNKYQIDIKGGEQKIWAVGADKIRAKYLKVKEGSPLVHMKRKLVTTSNGLNIYSSLYCNSEEFYLQDYF